MTSNDWIHALLSDAGFNTGLSDTGLSDTGLSTSTAPIAAAPGHNAHPHPDPFPHPDPLSSFSLPVPESSPPLAAASHGVWHQYPCVMESTSATYTTHTGPFLSTDNGDPLAALLATLGASDHAAPPSAPTHHYSSDVPHPGTIVLGHPDQDMQTWHPQEAPYSCGLAAERSAIEALTHHPISETQLRQEAQALGLYNPQGGTAAEDFGRLIETHTGVGVESHLGGTIAELQQHLLQGEKVFVGVDPALGNHLPDPQPLNPAGHAGDPLGLHPHPSHLVQVVGLEMNLLDPHKSQVIINDPGNLSGQGLEIPVDQFQQALNTTHGFMASTVTHPPNPSAVHHLLSSENPDHLTFGCKVSWSDSSHCVDIDGDSSMYYRGTTFYWDSDRTKVAGTWNCNSHHAYTKNGVDLGYAATLSDAALLIVKQNN